MKFSITIAVLGILMLSGCAASQPDLIAQQHTVLAPPTQLINCPQAVFPDEFKSNKDVAKFIVKSHNNNARCRDSIDKLVKYYEDAGNTVK